MDPANDNLPRFPLIMFIFAVCMAFVDLIFHIIALIPFVGTFFGIVGNALNGVVFYCVFFVWKFIFTSGKDKLNIGNYAIRGATGFITDQIPLISLLDEPLTIWRTWVAERKKAQEQQTIAANDNDDYRSANDNDNDYYAESQKAA